MFHRDEALHTLLQRHVNEMLYYIFIFIHMLQATCTSDTFCHVQYILLHINSHKTVLCKTLFICRSNVSDHVLHQYQGPGCLTQVISVIDCIQRHLEKHADDGHHCKSSVGKFRWQFFGFLCRIGWSQDLEAKVSSGSRCARRLILGNLAECHVGQDLSPACCRHLGDCRESVGHVGKFQSRGWGQVARQLSSDPRSTKRVLCCRSLYKLETDTWKILYNARKAFKSSHC